MNICFQYARPGSGATSNEIFGLDVAVTNLLSAWFKYGSAERFICRPVDLPSFEHFKALAAQHGVAESRCIGLDPRHPATNLSGIDCLFRPDPLIADPAWRRLQVKGTGFAACGLVHTMSGERIAAAVAELCIAPAGSGDALICPSPAIKQAVERLWQIYTDYLNHRFDGAFICPLELPVIPLGVDTDKFAALSTPAKRQQQRQALNAPDDEVILLFHGRLSFATKAHPLPLWLAAEQAAKRMQKKLRVVMLGYFRPLDMEQHFRALAADICKSFVVEFIANDDPRFPDGLWAGADIFISLADNIQESFGLTPVEAMAAGLPAIITDWDGYRASIRHGEDGFLIPTMAPPAAAGMAIAEAYYNVDNYGVSLMGAAQSTAIDIAACADAIVALADNVDKRRAFGQAGQQRAQSVFDWRHIIRAYENLWQELALKRQAYAANHPAIPADWPAVHPAYPNPWVMFGGFTSSVLSHDSRLRIVMTADELELIMKHEMNFFVPDLLVDQQSMTALIASIRQAGSAYAHDILAAFPTAEHNRIWRCLGWMLKHGAAVVEP